MPVCTALRCGLRSKPESISSFPRAAWECLFAPLCGAVCGANLKAFYFLVPTRCVNAIKLRILCMFAHLPRDGGQKKTRGGLHFSLSTTNVQHLGKNEFYVLFH
jgi:hypothetical protein